MKSSDNDILINSAFLGPDDVYTVTRLTGEIKRIIEPHFQQIWLQGEISNYKLHSSGHSYFSLKDEKAVINATMFKREKGNVKFQLEDGMEVLVCGRISLYERAGRYQILVSQMHPIGKGALQLAFEQRLSRFQKEGLLDAPKKPLPKFPLKIGVVTSPTGAALRDILQVTERKAPGIPIYIFPALVQGDDAPQSIASAIHKANALNNVDVLIVGRGGGSMEDLWCFNEDEVIYAVHDSHIPVVSGVGHEVDYTICDFVADLRAPTPSAAAQIVTEHLDEWREKAFDSGERLFHIMKIRLEATKRHFYHFSQERILYLALDNLQRNRLMADDYQRYLEEAMTKRLQEKKHAFQLLNEKMIMLNPLSTLSRGYSITMQTKNGKRQIVTDGHQVSLDETLQILLSKGELQVTVKQIQ